MELNISDIIFAAANFLIMTGVLTALLFKPVLKVLDARRESVKRINAEANGFLEEAKRSSNSGEQALLSARREADELLSKAQNDALGRSQAIISEAEERSKAICKEARDSIEAEKQKLWLELKDEAVRLGVEIARRIVGSRVPVSSTNRIEELVSAITAPETADTIKRKTAQLGPRANVELVTSAPLSDGERELVNGALDEVGAGSMMLLEANSDELIGGCILFIGDMMIDSSVSNMLKRAEIEMTAK